ncbi:MAG: hypothetical protein ING00_17625 [Roseomonas sp.]|nr:hypothetical protein [Roseomonas sp.]
MIAKLLLILADLSTPSAQRDSWFSWAAGQVAHAMIGAVLAGGVLFIVQPIWAFLSAALSYAALKELPDFLQDRTWANARDCTHDALFVTAGAALAVAIEGGHDRLFIVAVIAAGIGLWLGVVARLKPPICSFLRKEFHHV